MVECRPPFGILSRLRPDLKIGGIQNGPGFVAVRLVYNDSMDLTIIPTAPSMVTFIDGIPKTELGFTWFGTRTLAYTVASPPAMSAATVIFMPAGVGATGLNGARVDNSGPHDIFQPQPPIE